MSLNKSVREDQTVAVGPVADNGTARHGQQVPALAVFGQGDVLQYAPVQHAFLCVRLRVLLERTAACRLWQKLTG